MNSKTRAETSHFLRGEGKKLHSLLPLSGWAQLAPSGQNTVEESIHLLWAPVNFLCYSPSHSREREKGGWGRGCKVATSSKNNRS